MLYYIAGNQSFSNFLDAYCQLNDLFTPSIPKLALGYPSNRFHAHLLPDSFTAYLLFKLLNQF